MHQTKNVSEQARIIRILLEFDELDIEMIKTFRSFGEKLDQKVVHEVILQLYARYFPDPKKLIWGRLDANAWCRASDSI